MGRKGISLRQLLAETDAAYGRATGGGSLYGARGDTLALFIRQELEETYDAAAPVQAALAALDQAIAELTAVRRAVAALEGEQRRPGPGV